VPSVILTALAGERITPFDSDNRYADTPTTLKNLLADLDSWLQMYPLMPMIEDPSCPGTSFNHRWDQGRYETFRTKVHDYAGWVKDAFDEPDRDKSLALWQKVFGPDFKAPVSKVSEAALPALAPAPPAPAPRAPEEKFIQELGFRVAPRYRATIDARVLRHTLPGFRHGSLREMGHVGLGRELRFTVRTDVPAPYDLFWKVRNFGRDAELVAGGLRGQIHPDQGFRSRDESTLYRGKHYIECYIVKDGVVVATDRHAVDIR
jgi:hypothetical protein